MLIGKVPPRYLPAVVTAIATVCTRFGLDSGRRCKRKGGGFHFSEVRSQFLPTSTVHGLPRLATNAPIEPSQS
jgi:hypothetical protein